MAFYGLSKEERTIFGLKNKSRHC